MSSFSGLPSNNIHRAAARAYRWLTGPITNRIEQNSSNLSKSGVSKTSSGMINGRKVILICAIESLKRKLSKFMAISVLAVVRVVSSFLRWITLIMMEIIIGVRSTRETYMSGSLSMITLAIENCRSFALIAISRRDTMEAYAPINCRLKVQRLEHLLVGTEWYRSAGLLA